MKLGLSIKYRRKVQLLNWKQKAYKNTLTGHLFILFLTIKDSITKLKLFYKFLKTFCNYIYAYLSDVRHIFHPYLLTKLRRKFTVKFLFLLKFIYSEKATKFCEIFPLLLTTVHTRCGRVVTDFDWEAKNRFNF